MLPSRNVDFHMFTLVIVLLSFETLENVKVYTVTVILRQKKGDGEYGMHNKDATFFRDTTV